MKKGRLVFIYVPEFYFYTYQIIHCTVISDNVWYYVNGVPDSLEICGKDIGMDAPWVVTCADPPIGSSDKPTTPQLKGQRG